jgi:hypothetical protein
LRLGPWQGRTEGLDTVWLRWFDQNGHVLETPAEQAKKEAQRAEQAAQRAEQATQRAEQAEARVRHLEAELASRF